MEQQLVIPLHLSLSKAKCVTSFVDGNDYTGTTQTVTFQPGQTLAIVQVMLTDDNVYEGTQDFFGELTTTDSSVSIFEPDATAEITDEDGEAVDTCFSLK